MTAYVADTHAVIWYLMDDPALSAPAKAAFESTVESDEPIYVSAITLVEIIYLSEKGRLPGHMPATVLDVLNDDQSVLELVPLDRSVIDALPQIQRDQVPDMPDRIIAATAIAYDSPLITRDHKIQLTDLDTIW